MATSVNRIANGGGVTVGWAVLLDHTITLAEFATVEEACTYEVEYNQRAQTNMQSVETIKRGEYVRRKVGAATTYIRGGYDASTKRYSLTDVDDINREMWVKRGTMLHVGFTY